MNHQIKSIINMAAGVFFTLLLGSGAAAMTACSAAQKPLADTDADGITAVPEQTEELEISLDINNGGVQILPADSDEITAEFDSEYYEVSITEENNTWSVSAYGRTAMMGVTDDVRLYVPDGSFHMNVNVRNGNFEYAVPKNRKDKLDITAANSGLLFSSENHYGNSTISLGVTDQNFLKYGTILYPDYFTTKADGLEYFNDAGELQINITLSGYTNVEFTDLSSTSQDSFSS